MPAMGKRDYDISTSLTGDSGRAMLGLLTAQQRQRITGLMAQQRNALKQIVSVRRRIATQLRRFLAGKTPAPTEILALGRRYGELDGRISCDCAAAFAEVYRTLTDRQRRKMASLRNLQAYPNAGAYLYSQPMSEPLRLPDTDRFFRQSNATSRRRSR